MAKITTTTQIDDALGKWYSPNLIELAQPVLVANQFGRKTSIPKKHSDTVVWGSFDDLEEPTGALLEGIEPDAKYLRITRQPATARQYGSLVILSDVVELTVSDPTANQAQIKLSQQMAKYLDTLTFDVLSASGSLYNFQYGDNGLTPTEWSQEDSDEIVQRLMSNDAQPFEGVVTGVNKEGTEPLDESFYVITNTKAYNDIKKLASWNSIAGYPDPKMRKNGERGYVDNARICLTSKGPVDTSGAHDIYDAFFIAQDAYGVVDIDGGNAKMIFTPPGGPGDRLEQTSSLGWKAWHAAKILQERNLIRGLYTLSA